MPFGYTPIPIGLRRYGQQGPYSALSSPTLLAPVVVWKEQNYRRLMKTVAVLMYHMDYCIRHNVRNGYEWTVRHFPIAIHFNLNHQKTFLKPTCAFHHG